VARLISGLLDLAFPAICAGCSREGAALCERCRRDLDADLDRPPGVPIGLRATVPAPLLQVEWCAPFSGVVRRAVHGLKYGGERRLAAPLGAAVARRWSAAGVAGDLLVPVPVHADRRRERGFDQALLIASAAARELGSPLVDALERVRPTAPQFELDGPARAANVRGAFSVRPATRSAEEDGGGAVSAVAGRWVVLVDDVFTTGATLAACAAALIEAGAAAVSAIAVARES